jgi:hypothetical protein
MYVIIQAYVTTIAATAMTTNSSVASIGDMALLDFSVFFVKRFTLALSEKSFIFLFNMCELEINILSKHEGPP